MATVYKSTDAGAPTMTGAVNTLIAVLRACLVDGYGVKPAAGWSFTTIDAATYQALFTQGSKTGRVNKSLYVRDSAASVGIATAWMCTSCTVGASPVFTERFWANTLASDGVITKADQENGATAAWMIVADERTVVLVTKRSDWSPRGWAFTFFGDMDTGMAVDKGCCAVAGWHYGDASSFPYGTAARDMTNGYISLFGDIDGVFNVTHYTQRKAMGYASSIADTLYPINRFNRSTHLARLFAADATRYRGHIPFVWYPVAPPANFPYGAVDDGVDVQDGTKTKTLRHIQFGAANNYRAFIEVAGF